MKQCKTCIYFPCMKGCCHINGEGCDNHESIVEAEIRKGGKNEDT